MKKILLFLCLFFTANTANAKIIIFACEPEWGSLAREIVGNKAEVFVGLNYSKDPSFPVEMTQKLIHMVRNADLVFCGGNGLEGDWLPELLKRSFNPKIKSGENVLFAADYVEKLPPSATSVGGVARVHLNPHNVLKVAAELKRRLEIIDSFNAGIYGFYYNNFVKKWEEAMQRWEKNSDSLSGLPVIVNDDSWDYFIDWLHLKLVTKVRTQDAVTPDSRRIMELSKMVKSVPNRVIIFADFERRDAIFALGKRSSTRLVFLPSTSGGIPGVTNLFTMYNNALNRLLIDCAKGFCRRSLIAPAKPVN